MNDCPRRYTKRTRLIGQFHLFYVKTPLRRGFCYSNSGERMNNCPRRPKERGLSVSYRYLTTLGFCSVGIVESCT